MKKNRVLSIAPMIDWTYSHFRVWMRMLAPQALLYTEMQTIGAIKNNTEKALFFHPIEHPIALQLGGVDEKELARCAIMAEQEGYDEVNLNLGCPSDKVQAGRFGACLMREPKQVAMCLQAMKQVVQIPVTAKIRLGIDHQDSYAFFHDFACQLVEAGADKLVVHARKAWLNGLNPKQNRTIPPINYDYVYQLKKELPQVPIVINGNITHDEAIKTHLTYVDGVMIGRLACDNPYQIARIHNQLHPRIPLLSRSELLQRYVQYLHTQIQNSPCSILIKPIFNLAHGLPSASQWKKKLMLIMQSRQFTLLDELVDDIQTLETITHPF